MSARREPHALAPELARLIEAQERYESTRRHAQMRAGVSLCDLAYANPYDAADPAVVQAIRDALDEPRTLALQYTPYGGATIPRRLAAGQLSRMYRRRFHYRDVILTPGAMAALNIVFRSLRSDQGTDEVIVITPCWMDYPLYLAQLGLKAVLVPVDARTLHLDLDAIQRALTPRTRAVVLSQPANPTGVLYTREELRALAELLRSDRRIEPPLLISDECHRDIRPAGTPFTSPLECYSRSVIVHSFGKSLGMQGQRIGYAAVSPEMKHGRQYAALLAQLCRAMGYCTPTALMQLALPRLLELKPDLTRADERRVRVRDALRAGGYDFVEPDATFFLYPRAPGGDDLAFADRLAARGVLVLPSSVFHHRGHFRLSLTASDAMLDRALPVLEELGPANAAIVPPPARREEIALPALAVASCRRRPRPPRRRSARRSARRSRRA